jgi:hypothetical protein
MIKQLNVYFKQRYEQSDHDENACFKQYVDEIIKIRSFSKNESFYDRKNFLLNNARKALDQVEIEESQNIDQIDRK